MLFLSPDLSQLVVDGAKLTGVYAPEFSSTPSLLVTRQLTAQELVGLTDAGKKTCISCGCDPFLLPAPVATDSGGLDDSGIGPMLLESPCIPSCLSPSFSLEDQLALLEPLPHSPDGDM